MRGLAEPLHAEVSALRRQVIALAVALRAEDAGASATIASRLRRSVARASRRLLASEAHASLPAAVEAMLRAHLHTAAALLSDLPVALTASEAVRLQHWDGALTSLGAPGSSADLFDLDAAGKDLSASQLAQLHLLQCRFAGGLLSRGSLRESVIDGCDFTEADLTATCWRGALVTHGRLRGARLVEAELGHAIFTDCDLRGAELRSRVRDSAARSIWVRCDLRDTVWTAHSLRHAHFVECRVVGARGLSSAAANLVRCEASRRWRLWDAVRTAPADGRERTSRWTPLRAAR